MSVSLSPKLFSARFILDTSRLCDNSTVRAAAEIAPQVVPPLADLLWAYVPLLRTAAHSTDLNFYKPVIIIRATRIRLWCPSSCPCRQVFKSVPLSNIKSQVFNQTFLYPLTLQSGRFPTDALVFPQPPDSPVLEPASLAISLAPRLSPDMSVCVRLGYTSG